MMPLDHLAFIPDAHKKLKKISRKNWPLNKFLGVLIFCMQQSPRRCQERKLTELSPTFQVAIPKIAFSNCEHCPSTESAPEASQRNALLEKDLLSFAVMLCCRPE